MSSASVTKANAMRARWKTKVVDLQTVVPATVGGLVTKYDNFIKPIDKDNDEVDQPDNQVWATFSIVEAIREQRTLGNSPDYRTTGTCFIQLFAPASTGEVTVRTLADFVVDAFSRVTDTGVTFRTPTIRPVGRREAGDWWQLNVSCPFYYDEIN